MTFPEFTPLRTIPAGTEANPTAGNVIGKTVAYSYPDHPEEKPDNSKGDAGSMDSPFDFVWKMEKQKTLLASAYDTSGEVKTVTSTSSWDNTKSPKDTWNKYKRGSPASAGTEAKQAFIPGLDYIMEPVMISFLRGQTKMDFQMNRTEHGTGSIRLKQEQTVWDWHRGQHPINIADIMSG